jgi:hypothetical protein
MIETLVDTPVLLHIGYHKTGSSWLQRELFNMPRAWDSTSGERSSPDALSFAAPWSRRDIARWLVWDDPLVFDAEDARRFFMKQLSTVTGSSVPVISYERLSGLPQFGGYDGPEVAERLVQVFPSARVLIVVREQASMLVSLWKGYIERGGIRPLSRFVSQQFGSSSLGPRAQHLLYHRLIARYRELFGPMNVLVLPFEQLVRDPGAFTTAVTTFAKTDQRPQRVDRSRENPSLSPAGAAVTRFLNLAIVPVDVDGYPQPRLSSRVVSVVKTADRMLLHLVPHPDHRRLERTVASLLGDTYAESNTRTALLTGIDLKSYGYVC